MVETVYWATLMHPILEQYDSRVMSQYRAGSGGGTANLSYKGYCTSRELRGGLDFLFSLKDHERERSSLTQLITTEPMS